MTVEASRWKPSPCKEMAPQCLEDAIVPDAMLLKKNVDLDKRNADYELTVEGLERARNFYLKKLRDNETMLQIC